MQSAPSDFLGVMDSAHGTTESSVERSNRLALPTEVLEVIVQYVWENRVSERQEIDDKRRQILMDKRNQVKDFDSETRLSYLDDHTRAPILNSLQSLGVADRRFATICDRLLWKTISFPTSLPAPAKFWVTDILPRVGSLVDSLSITLSRHTSRPEEKAHKAMERDNTEPYITSEYGAFRTRVIRTMIAPSTVFAILPQCPNLSTLNLTLPFVDHIDDGFNIDLAHMGKFLFDLVPIIPHISRLKHFKLEPESYTITDLPEKPICHILEQVPLLESFIFRTASTHKTDQVTYDNVGELSLHEMALGPTLSQMKYLTRLGLKLSHVVRDSWCSYSWPGIITALELLVDCSLSMLGQYKLIHLIGPNLTRLYLMYYNFNSGVETCPLFNLPELTELTIEAEHHEILGAFQDCRKLQSLHYGFHEIWTWNYVTNCILKFPWPELKSLDLVYHTKRIHSQNIPRFESTLEDACLSRGIKFRSIIPHYANADAHQT